jgi:acetylornithine deacetylase/succinyl-diaminopimelate desuccinylase-like protein
MIPDNLRTPSPDAGAALERARAFKQEHLDELIAFLRIPSVGTQPERKTDTEAAAQWLADSLKLAGMNDVRTIATARNPLVYADWLEAGPDAPTVLIYGHYDVQPAEPLEEWLTPPFEPTIQGNHLFARGAADDKGQLFIHLKSVESYLHSAGRLPVNVKFIIEGEEESGGHSLQRFVPDNKELLAADIALISDTHILSPEQPSLVYGLRGMCYTYLDITGPAFDLHSGAYGGAVDNPLNAAAQIISRLKDPSGKILIPGFYDKVRPLTAEERRLLAEFPLTEDDILRETGAKAIWGEPEFTMVERLGARPTLDVNGIVGGYIGAGTKTVLPSRVHAKISMRLVPDQDVHEVFELFQAYVEEIAPPTVKVACSFAHGAPASIVDLADPALQAAAVAYEEVFGRRPVYAREGGSLPVVGLFQEELNLETVLMGFGLPDDRIHSPNERFYLPNFYRGIETAVRFLDIYGRMAR